MKFSRLQSVTILLLGLLCSCVIRRARLQHSETLASGLEGLT